MVRFCYHYTVTSQRIGYSRVSTTDQNPDGQRDALEAAGVDQLFIDRFTGTKARRPEWDRALEILRDGDTLVFTRLDRLGRSAKDLQDIAAYAQASGINLESTQQPIDTSTPEGKMFFAILAAFAEFEHDLIVARTRDGLAAARARGRSGGRPARLSPRQIEKIRADYDRGEQTVQQLAEDFKVSRPTIYRALATTSEGPSGTLQQTS
jgi:DNA invertase Pin-like site-specific DNA recombinase